MMIGLLSVDGPLVNLALMKISTFYKQHGIPVELISMHMKPKEMRERYSKIYASTIFTKSKAQCVELQKQLGDKLVIAGSGWDLTTELTSEIDKCLPDYSIYSPNLLTGRIKGIMTREARHRKAAQIVNAGIGFTSRGCIRQCAFCVVPRKEGSLRQDQEIGDLLNPRSNVLILLDNNLTADPFVLEKLKEVNERKLVLDINQGLDIRIMTDQIAQALSTVNHLRRLHYAWDRMEDEQQVLDGIKLISRWIPPSKQMCFILVGFDTSFEEDMYRFQRLRELKVEPYVMVYGDPKPPHLSHFARWVNGHFFRVCQFEEYEPLIRFKVLSRKSCVEN